ncbi:MAG: hypothetical protein GXY65_11345 [Rhodococcus sp.]|uniref:hypothetical protein n=2 Tax=Rhodococcus TaxID=1827 RepID=UPI0016B15D48|nr:hypothetical protein [Rhodococcus sp. (in: high G+C Gram-positive bacteria)]NLV79913.1 hypothetical protein [Rhodococcus sp. (in: high G+C Gram-positive bacteria)]
MPAVLTRHRPLPERSASGRMSAYIYGNLIVLATLVPITTTSQYVGIAIVLGTSFSTFLAHAFAEAVALSVHEGKELSRAERLGELRDSVPILSSAVMPCLILATAWVGWLEPRTAQILAEVTVLVRIASTVFVIQRLLGRRPTTSTVVAAAAIAVTATIVVVVKIALTH